MPNLTPYSLRFRGGLHVGTRGVNLEEAGVSIASDTLFAALVDALHRAGEDVDAFAKAYQASPPFVLSSAFPFVGGVRFYPMPADLARLFGPAKMAEYGKKLGKIRYFSEGLLAHAMRGGKLDEWLFPLNETETPQKGVTLQGNALWLKVDEIETLPKAFQRDEKRRHALPRLEAWTVSRVPRVTIDRVNSASNIFHAGKVEFAQECGLWFGIQWRSPEARFGSRRFQDAFNLALNMLSDDGLGGERTTGYGMFTFSQGDVIRLADPQQGGLMYLVSRYHPREEEIQPVLADPRSAYHLEKVGGWLRTFGSAAQRRKRLFLLGEGGLIPMLPEVAGDLVDLAPAGISHPVYRSGLALAVGWPG